MRRVGIICGCLLALWSLSACGTAATTSGSTSTPTSVATTPPVTPTPLPHHKVGEQVAVGNWLIVINSAGEPASYQGYSPPAYKTVVIDVSLRNLATTSQNMDPKEFDLLSGNGTYYYADISISNTQGTIATNSTVEGKEVFLNVSKGETTFTLEFAPDQVDVVAIWDISA